MYRNKDSQKTTLDLEEIIFSNFVKIERNFFSCCFFLAASLRKECYTNKHLFYLLQIWKKVKTGQDIVCSIQEWSIYMENLVLVMPRSYIEERWSHLQECETSQLFVNTSFWINFYDLIYCPALLVIPPGTFIWTVANIILQNICAYFAFAYFSILMFDLYFIICKKMTDQSFGPVHHQCSFILSYKNKSQSFFEKINDVK